MTLCEQTTRFDAFALLAALVLAVFVQTAAAQTPASGILNPDAPPAHAAVTLDAAFAPDPLRLSRVAAGGPIDVGLSRLGTGCLGFVESAPDVRLTLNAPLPLLRLILIGDTVITDTALIVRTPDGRFVCNDNVLGLVHPMVDIPQAPAGNYAIWAADFTPGALAYGELYLTRGEAVVPGSTGLIVPPGYGATATPAPLPTPTQPAGTFFDAEAEPRFGAAALAHGFLPDPFWRAVEGGGAVALPASDVCAGYASGAPTFRLAWGGQSTRLRLMFIPLDSEADAALWVRAPDGSAVCNRDFAPGFTRPLVEFVNPGEGVYTVWAADETGANTRLPGILYVTELNVSPETIRQAAPAPVEPISGLDATAGDARSLDGASDPYALAGLIAGGSVDVRALNPDLARISPVCAGYFPAAPSATFNLPDLLYLRLFFVSDAPDADATLIVRLADGRWYCADDSYNTRHPTLNLIDLPGGSLHLWVGSYTADTAISGTLYLTRGDANPLDPLRSP